MKLSIEEHKKHLDILLKTLESKQADKLEIDREINLLNNEIMILSYQICLAESRKITEFDVDDRRNLWKIKM